jgi:hypothetical protein
MLILHVLLHPSNSGHELLKIQGNEVTEILSSDSEDDDPLCSDITLQNY